jgi:hypothetical protein
MRKHIRKYNESLVDTQPDKNIYITAINSDNPNEYREPRLSPYIEDGQLTPAKFIVCHNTDVDGRYRTGVAGIYPVTPEYFDVEIRKTHRGDKTWYVYSLNKLGWDYIKSATKGSWIGDFELVDEKYIQNIISKNEKTILQIQNGIERYKKLLEI